MAPTQEMALYVGEGGNCLTDGTPLVPHETIAQVPASEAEASELWEPVTDGKPASSEPRNSAPKTRSKHKAAPVPADPPDVAMVVPDPPAEGS